jgi:hypothetical protein
MTSAWWLQQKETATEGRNHSNNGILHRQTPPRCVRQLVMKRRVKRLSREAIDNLDIEGQQWL